MLPDYSESSFEHGGQTKPVFRTGSGPAVVIIHEIPGITPDVAAFGRRVAAAGFTAVLPSLFGTPGRAPTNGYVTGQLASACITREFSTLALRRTSPATVWLRALARSAHEECGGPGVGVVGMCLTGGFALAMMVDESVLAPVLSQPSLPFGVTAKHRADLGVSDSDLAAAQQRVLDDGICVLGLRFTGDKLSPPDRFAALHDALGDSFVGVEIDSSPGNPHGLKKMAHSVLTEELVDEPGHPTRQALDQVLDLFRTRLLPA